MRRSWPRIDAGCTGYHHDDDGRHIWHDQEADGDCPVHPGAPFCLLVIDWGEDRVSTPRRWAYREVVV